MKIPVIQQNDINLNTNTVRPAGMPEIQPGNNVGDTISDLGKSINTSGEMLEKAYSLAEKTKAQNILSLKLSDIEARADADTDLSPARQQKYHEEIDKAVRDSSSGISIQQNKDLFMSEADKDAGIKKIKVNNSFLKKTIDQGKADIVIRQEEFKNQFISSGSALERQNAFLRDDALLNDAVNSGYMSREQAAEARVKRAGDWNKALAEKDMLIDPGAVRTELEKGSAGAYKDIPEETRTSLIMAADRRETVLKELAKKEETVKQVTNRNDYLMQVANGSFNYNLTPSQIAEVGIKDPGLGIALQRVVDNRGKYVAQDDNNTSYQNLARQIFLQSKSQEEISDFLVKELGRTGKEISDDKLAILISAAMERGKILGVSKQDSGNGRIDPKQGVIDSAIKTFLNNKNKLFNVGNMIAGFLSKVSQGQDPQEAHRQTLDSEIKRTNPLSVRYKVGDVITNPKSGESAEITGFNENGSPIVKRKVSGKQPAPIK